MCRRCDTATFQDERAGVCCLKKDNAVVDVVYLDVNANVNVNVYTVILSFRYLSLTRVRAVVFGVGLPHGEFNEWAVCLEKTCCSRRVLTSQVRKHATRCANCIRNLHTVAKSPLYGGI